MGTNYYHHTVPLTPVVCTCCGRPLRCEACEPDGGRLHIGKSSAGWQFLFQATDTIRSFADWCARLETGGTIVDQYGKEHALADFIAMVNFKATYRDYRSHVDAQPFERSYFKDADGYEFNEREFS